MDIHSLKIYCDSVKTEKFTEAAKLNGVTQSAVSQQIVSLENVFKSRLIERSRKRFRLTPEGQVVYDYSKRIIKIYDSLHTNMLELKYIISGTIRVSTIYSIGLHVLPAFVSKYSKLYPTVNVLVDYRHASRVYEDVSSNVVDLGLVAYPAKDRHLEVVPLYQEPLVLICHPQHPLANQKSVKLVDLKGQKFIGFDQAAPTRKALDQIFRQHGVEIHNFTEFDNVETVKRAVEIHAGVSIVPQSTVVQEIEKKTLTSIQIKEGPFYRPVAAIYRKQRELTPAMNILLAILKGEA